MLLETKNLMLSFGGVRAIDGVSLGVSKGEIRALIGPNGAGKTTFFNAISGRLPPDSGAVIFDGTDIAGWKPRDIVRLGLVRTFQISSIFSTLTVFENVRTACQSSTNLASSVFLPATRRLVAVEAERILDTLGITAMRDVRASELSYGDQRVVEIALALALRPKLLLMDEPTAGMSPSETGRIAKLIKQLKPDVTIIIVEHDMEMIMDLSDRISVFDRGSLIVEGSPEEVRSDAVVRRIYLGNTAC